jgi:cation diffusion facilitator CzcD-associated flavoprotein CzcO
MARLAVIGAGPGGLVAAKEALQAGFDVTLFEASDDVGGQWHTTAPHSGIWPGMHTNTSRAMTAFSDFPAPADHPLHPAATQIHAYLRTYAAHFGITERIRFSTPARHVAPGWRVNGERFDGVVVASGRFRRPRVPPGLEPFTGELLHAFDYPGAEPFRDRRTLVYGNGISGLEIAADVATVAPVVSACRKPRYVIRKNVDGVSSDWQWYTLFGALERRHLPREQFSRTLRERVVRVAGNPADFGAPRPDPDILAAGLSLCQDYLQRVGEGRIVCRPAIAGVDGRTVAFADGTSETVDAIVCATGYDLDLPYLDRAVWRVAGDDLRLYRRTLHPDLPGFGAVGQFAPLGPSVPLLELQARWIIALWTGEVAPPDTGRMRTAMAEPPPPLETHNAFALTLSEELGAAPDPLAHPDLMEPLVFGPMLPPRYRLQGPGATPAVAARRFAEQHAASPRAPVDPADVAALRGLGLAEVADRLEQPSPDDIRFRLGAPDAPPAGTAHNYGSGGAP